MHFVATLLALIRVKWIDIGEFLFLYSLLGLSFFKFLISFAFDVSVASTYSRVIIL